MLVNVLTQMRREKKDMKEGTISAKTTKLHVEHEPNKPRTVKDDDGQDFGAQIIATVRLTGGLASLQIVVYWARADVERR